MIVYPAFRLIMAALQVGHLSIDNRHKGLFRHKVLIKGRISSALALVLCILLSAKLFMPAAAIMLIAVCSMRHVRKRLLGGITEDVTEAVNEVAEIALFINQRVPPKLDQREI